MSENTKAPTVEELREAYDAGNLWRLYNLGVALASDLHETTARLEALENHAADATGEKLRCDGLASLATSECAPCPKGCGGIMALNDVFRMLQCQNPECRVGYAYAESYVSALAERLGALEYANTEMSRQIGEMTAALENGPFAHGYETGLEAAKDEAEAELNERLDIVPCASCGRSGPREMMAVVSGIGELPGEFPELWCGYCYRLADQSCEGPAIDLRADNASSMEQLPAAESGEGTVLRPINLDIANKFARSENYTRAFVASRMNDTIEGARIAATDARTLAALSSGEPAFPEPEAGPEKVMPAKALKDWPGN